MTKKDYELIAGVIRSIGVNGIESDRVDMAQAFARALEDTNPRFDRDRFLAACGVDDAL